MKSLKGFYDIVLYNIGNTFYLQINDRKKLLIQETLSSYSVAMKEMNRVIRENELKVFK